MPRCQTVLVFKDSSERITTVRCVRPEGHTNITHKSKHKVGVWRDVNHRYWTRNESNDRGNEMILIQQECEGHEWSVYDVEIAKHRCRKCNEVQK